MSEVIYECRNCALGVSVEMRDGKWVHRYRQQNKAKNRWHIKFEECTKLHPVKKPVAGRERM